jgi:hypothetical protein
MEHKLKYYGLALLTAAAAMFVNPPALAQQINGIPGSPSATVTIDGKQIPPSPMKFGGCFNLAKGGNHERQRETADRPESTPRG